MTRHRTRKPNAPRKSALAKAALRHTSTGVTAAPAVQHAAGDPARPRVDFLDPFMRQAAMQAKGISLCAFLMTLAAFQRGLKVTFHYERASRDPRFGSAQMQGLRGEIFTISDGNRSHIFSRTLGDLTDRAADAVAEDKHLTKAALKRAGLRTPDGIVVAKDQTALIAKFLAQSPGKRFVVKPIAGSLAKDVDADIAADEVPAKVAAHAGGRVIVEEFVTGTEYRATVVDGRCVAVSQRVAPGVTGDGSSTLAQLMTALNETAKHCPFWEGVTDTKIIGPFIARKGYTFDTIPQAGVHVALSNTAYGVHHLDVTDTIDDHVKQTAIKAARAIGLLTCGIDIIVTPQAVPVILELNQRAYLGFHSFPRHGAGQGNAVAEAIIDVYFPETVGRRVHPGLVYDFTPLRAALKTMQFGDISLPVIGANWTVLRFVETGSTAASMVKLVQTVAQMTGVFMTSAARAGGGFDLCLAYAPENFRLFVDTMPAQFRNRIVTLDAQAQA